MYCERMANGAHPGHLEAAVGSTLIVLLFILQIWVAIVSLFQYFLFFHLSFFHTSISAVQTPCFLASRKIHMEKKNIEQMPDYC